ncbi:hypothetical protein D3C73_1577930 [compost metagenome]
MQQIRHLLVHFQEGKDQQDNNRQNDQRAPRQRNEKRNNNRHDEQRMQGNRIPTFGSNDKMHGTQ